MDSIKYLLLLLLLLKILSTYDQTKLCAICVLLCNYLNVRHVFIRLLTVATTGKLIAASNVRPYVQYVYAILSTLTSLYDENKLCVCYLQPKFTRSQHWMCHWFSQNNKKTTSCRRL